MFALRKPATKTKRLKWVIRGVGIRCGGNLFQSESSKLDLVGQKRHLLRSPKLADCACRMGPIVIISPPVRVKYRPGMLFHSPITTVFTEI